MKTNLRNTGNAVAAMASACVECSQKLAAKIEKARRNVLVELRETALVPESLFRLAVNEAEALAWETDYPHLLFPALAAEKIQAIAGWGAHQEWIRRKNSALAVSV